MVWSRSLKLALVVLFGAGIPAVLAHSAGPSPGYTGAPGEFTCRQCHSSFPLNDGVGMVTIEGVPAEYEPGASYTITVHLSHPDRRRWGFQLTALTGALDPAGSFTITDTAHTQVKTDDGKSYVSHRTAGTYAGTANGASWSFRWNAPASDVGPIDFYVCGNAANNNDQQTGDNIYSTFATAVPRVIVVPFTDVSNASGLETVTGGVGIAWADFDNDGDQDALVARDGEAQLLRNDGGVFADVAPNVGLGGVVDVRSAAWGDFDNDGRADLLLATASAARLMRNTPAGFVDDGTSGWFAASGPTSVVSWVDIDGDGLLDVFASGSSGATLLHNDGAAGFSDVTAASGLANLSGVTAAAWLDDDRDGRMDLAVAAASGLTLMRQTASGAFVDATASAGIPAIAGASDVMWADIDSDGDLDLVVSTAASVHALVNTGYGEYEDASTSLGLSSIPGGGLAVEDSDGDGRMDLLIARPAGVELLEFDGASFVDVTESLGLADARGDAATWVDANGDGRADLFVLSAAGASLHRNPSTRQMTVIQAITASLGAAVGGSVRYEKGTATLARAVDGGGGRSQAPSVALFPTPGFGTATIRAVFADGTGRQATVGAGAASLVLEEPESVPSIASAAVKKKDDGTRKLQVDGTGFATSIEVVEVDGGAMDTTRYPQMKRLADGTCTRVSATDSSFDAMVPRGRPVRVTTFNPSTGIRSAPLVFVRP